VILVSELLVKTSPSLPGACSAIHTPSSTHHPGSRDLLTAFLLQDMSQELLSTARCLP